MGLIIYVDADATPRDALATVDDLAEKFKVEVVTVSTINHHYQRKGHITVDAHPQAVDMVIVSKLHQHDSAIVVTQDYGLAALVLGQGAAAISPSGTIYTNDNIDRLLFERDINARARRATGRAKGPSARTSKDARKFANALETLIQDVLLIN